MRRCDSTSSVTTLLSQVEEIWSPTSTTPRSRWLRGCCWSWPSVQSHHYQRRKIAPRARWGLSLVLATKKFTHPNLFQKRLQGGPSPGGPWLGWISFEMLHHFARLLSHFCQFPINPRRTGQRAEQHKSKSTQPRFTRIWATMYLHPKDQ